MPSTTSHTCGELGTHTMINSDVSATWRGEPASRAPWDTASSIGPLLREATATSCPALMRWPVIGNPMAPSPMNPIRIVSLRVVMVGATLRELGQPLGRAGEELGHHGVDLAQVPPTGQRVQREGLSGQVAVTTEGR